jgi:hypothetical protein
MYALVASTTNSLGRWICKYSLSVVAYRFYENVNLEEFETCIFVSVGCYDSVLSFLKQSPLYVYVHVLKVTVQ